MKESDFIYQFTNFISMLTSSFEFLNRSFEIISKIEHKLQNRMAYVYGLLSLFTGLIGLMMNYSIKMLKGFSTMELVSIRGLIGVILLYYIQ